MTDIKGMIVSASVMISLIMEGSRRNEDVLDTTIVQLLLYAGSSFQLSKYFKTSAKLKTWIARWIAIHPQSPQNTLHNSHGFLISTISKFSGC